MGVSSDEATLGANNATTDIPQNLHEKDEGNVSEKVAGDSALESQPIPEAAAPPSDADTMPTWQWTLVIAAIYSTQFLYALDNTIVANVQPVIVNEFNAVAKITWLSQAYLLTSLGVNQAWGKVYFQFNTKITYLVSVFFFEVGSAICGAAPNIDAFIIGRALQGIFGSGMYVGLMTLIALTTSIQQRPLYVAGSGMTWGIGTALGPIIGGAFTDSAAGWRWAFYLNLFIGALFLPVYIFMLPNKDPRPGEKWVVRAKEMDYVGIVLMVGAFVSFLMAIAFGGVEYEWNSGQIIGLFVCSGVLWILLGIQQVYTIGTTVERRVFPVEFFSNRTVLTLFAVMACGGAALFLPVFFAPLLFQFARGDGALESGVRLLPFIFLLVTGVMLNGGLMAKFGYYMPWYAVGSALVVIGGALMYTVNSDTAIAPIYGYLVILGFGIGLWLQASFPVGQALLKPHEIPQSVGFLSTGQIAGMTIALAIANAIFINKAIQTITPLVGSDVDRHQIEQAVAGASSDLVAGLDDSTRKEVIDGIVDSIGQIYILVIVAGGLAFLLSLTMKREKLFGAK